MNHQISRISFSMIAVFASSAMLAACSGGGSNNKSNPTSSAESTTTPASQTSVAAAEHVAAECPEFNGAFAEAQQKPQIFATFQAQNGAAYTITQEKGFTVVADNAPKQGWIDTDQADAYTAKCSAGTLHITVMKKGVVLGTLEYTKKESNIVAKMTVAGDSSKNEEVVLVRVEESKGGGGSSSGGSADPSAPSEVK